MNNLINIHSFSIYGSRNVNLATFDHLLNNGLIKPVTQYANNNKILLTQWYFKPMQTIKGQFKK